MAHVTKMTRAACGHMFKHFERSKDENGEYLKFGNQDIDPRRSPGNYNLAPAREINQGEFVRQRCEDVGCLKRKNVNVMCSWIVTAPQSLVGTGHEKQFFEASYSFLSNRYGKDNIVSAYVHMDEVTPHIHFAFVPVVTDKRNGKLKVSAKECVDRRDLQSFHTDLDRHLSASMGALYRGDILNGATKEGNKSIEELKQNTAAKIMREARENASKILSEGQARVESLKADESALLGRIEAYKGAFRSIDEIERTGKRTLTGNITMTAAESAKLKEQAAAYWSEKSRADKYQRELQHIRGLAAQVTPLRQEVVQLRRERNELAGAIESIKNVIRSEPDLHRRYQQALEAGQSTRQRDTRGIIRI